MVALAAVLFGVIVVGLGTDGRTRGLLYNTLALGQSVLAISLPLGGILAWLVSRTDVPFRRLAAMTLTIMIFVPIYLQAAAWDAGFGLQGWFQFAHDRLGTTPWLYGWRGAVWVHAMAATPWIFLLLASALRALPRAWEESARLHGTEAQVAWYIVAPHMIAPTIVASIWVLVMTSGEIAVTDLYQVRTYAEEVYVGFAANSTDTDSWVDGNAGWASCAMIVWLTVAAIVVCDRLLQDADRPASPAIPPNPLRSWRRPAGCILLAMIGLVAAIPVANLLAQLGTEVTQVGDARIRSWSLEKSWRLLLHTPDRFRDEIGWTLGLAQLAAITAVLLGIPAAWWSLRQPVWRGMTMIVVGLTLAIPGPTLGIATIGLFQSLPEGWIGTLYDETPFAPWLCLTIRSWPFATLVLWLAFRSIPEGTLEQARSEGAGSWSQLVWVVLPQRRLAIGTAWMVAFAVAAGELTATILVVPPGVTTLSIRIFGLIHYGVEDRLAALCLWMVLVFGGLGWLTIAVARRALREDWPVE